MSALAGIATEALCKQQQVVILVFVEFELKACDGNVGVDLRERGQKERCKKKCWRE